MCEVDSYPQRLGVASQARRESVPTCSDSGEAVNCQELTPNMRRLAFSCAAAIAMMGCGKADPRGQIFAKHTSPDGKVRCVIYAQTPSWPQVSPNIWTFSIHSLPDDRSLPGMEFSKNNDSIGCTEASVTWSSNQVSVDASGIANFVVGSFADGTQTWSRLDGYKSPAKR